MMDGNFAHHYTLGRRTNRSIVLMEWLKDIIKHLAISRALVAAVFVTAVTMFVGARAAPQLVPAVPTEWSAALFATMVLTGCLLVVWGAGAIWGLLAKGVRSTTASIAAATISTNEAEVLLAMGRNPTTPLNVDRLDYEQAPFSRLEILQLMRTLEQKGLIRMNEWDETLVSLTQSGRERALELERRSRAA